LAAGGERRRRLPSAKSCRFRWLGFWGGTFVTDWPQLDRARGFAFLAPMPLGTRKPLPHSAIVANENFFSHANLVLRRPNDVAKRLFLPAWPKILVRLRKKRLPRAFQFLQCASNRSVVMNMMIVLKRSLVVVLTLSALALCAVAANQNEPCPLPVSSADNSSAGTQSPEQPKCLRAVHHNGMIICLPCPAWDAHIAHGDMDAGPCNKPGNETPPGQ